MDFPRLSYQKNPGTTCTICKAAWARFVPSVPGPLTQRAFMPYPACLDTAGTEDAPRRGFRILKHNRWRGPQADNPRRMRVYSGLQGWNKENAQQEQAWDNGVRNNLLT